LLLDEYKATKLRRNMPYIWTTTDTRNAVIATLLPTGVAVVSSGFIGSQRNLQAFSKIGKTPNWAIRDPRVLGAIDFAVVAPVGYASYLVYKFGGGFDYSDTTVALSLYGVNLASVLVSSVAFKSHSLACIATNTTLVHVTALAAAIAFNKVDKIASYWMAPYAIWTGYNAALALYIHYKNSKGTTLSS
jgi:tryptophan-rich sensory protein